VSELIKKSAAELAALIASGDVSSREVTQAHLDQIDRVDGAINAFLYVDSDGALNQADAADKARSESGNKSASALNGVPLALKDVLAQKGIPTTSVRKFLKGGARLTMQQSWQS